MQHKGRLTGPVEPARPTGADELRAAARDHAHARRVEARSGARSASRRGRYRSPPASGRMTVTSIEPVYWGVGNDLFAFLVTYHQHGEQKHPTAGVAQGAARAPGRGAQLRRRAPLVGADGDHAVLADDRHLDRAVLARRPAAQPARTGTPPSVHIPIVEDFVDRMAAKMDGHEGALPFEVINRTASAHFTGGIPIGDSSESGAVDPYQRAVRPAGPARDGRQRDAGQHRA